MFVWPPSDTWTGHISEDQVQAFEPRALYNRLIRQKKRGWGSLQMVLAHKWHQLFFKCQPFLMTSCTQIQLTNITSDANSFSVCKPLSMLFAAVCRHVSVRWHIGIRGAPSAVHFTEFTPELICTQKVWITAKAVMIFLSKVLPPRNAAQCI